MGSVPLVVLIFLKPNSIQWVVYYCLDNLISEFSPSISLQRHILFDISALKELFDCYCCFHLSQYGPSPLECYVQLIIESEYSLFHLFYPIILSTRLGLYFCVLLISFLFLTLSNQRFLFLFMQSF